MFIERKGSYVILFGSMDRVAMWWGRCIRGVCMGAIQMEELSVCSSLGDRRQ